MVVKGSLINCPIAVYSIIFYFETSCIRLKVIDIFIIIECHYNENVSVKRLLINYRVAVFVAFYFETSCIVTKIDDTFIIVRCYNID